MEYEIDASKEPEYMKGYHIVKSIYEIRNEYLLNEDDKIEYDELFINKNVLSLIDEINFIYVKDWANSIDGVDKVGYLLNFKVFITPIESDIIRMSCKGERVIEIKIKL
jgi:hypothetical protein